MQNGISKIEVAEEKRKITEFLEKTFKKQGIDRAVMGLSGGIDSSVAFFLLKEVLPPKKIFVVHLYYTKPTFEHIEKSVKEAKIPNENINILSIQKPVDETMSLLKIGNKEEDKIRKGNITARTRMIILFDLAKKYNALVCGTENKSENLLGYFTRFGDQASDIEPITHLYKTQIFDLAKYLGVPTEIIDQKPTAGLWDGQTDEEELGFTYTEADEVMYLYFHKKLSVEEITKKGFENTSIIITKCERNKFKHETPYALLS